MRDQTVAEVLGSSAVVPLLVAEETTSTLQRLFQLDTELLVWWATEIECVSAIARLERDGQLTRQATTQALERLEALKAGWNEIEPLERVRRTARRLLRVHNLRAADSLQLAAMVAASEGQPASLQVVSLDDRLIEAAEREDLEVVDLEFFRE